MSRLAWSGAKTATNWVPAEVMKVICRVRLIGISTGKLQCGLDVVKFENISRPGVKIGTLLGHSPGTIVYCYTSDRNVRL